MSNRTLIVSAPGTPIVLRDREVEAFVWAGRRESIHERVADSLRVTEQIKQ